jgi:hypothetical protein
MPLNAPIAGRARLNCPTARTHTWARPTSEVMATVASNALTLNRLPKPGKATVMATANKMSGAMTPRSSHRMMMPISRLTNATAERFDRDREASLIGDGSVIEPTLPLDCPTRTGTGSAAGPAANSSALYFAQDHLLAHDLARAFAAATLSAASVSTLSAVTVA